MTALLSTTDLGKQFPKGDSATVALRDVSLHIGEGEFVTVLGRSGCGKSTLLNLLAGLTTPTHGSVTYRDQVLSGPNQDIGYLTQHDTLMPWRSVLRNVEMPLEIRGIAKEERRTVAAELVRRVGLGGFEKHYPRELSGGMRRRTSLARMLASSPETLLMDEPFGALDAQLRAELQEELLRLWQVGGQTVVFITHDIEEAMLLGDRVIVLGSLGRVLLDRAVDLPRPRTLEKHRLDPAFVALHGELSAVLKEYA